MSHDIVRTLSVGQAVEIQDACRRQEVTLAELKMLTSGGNLRRSIDFLNGTLPTEAKASDSFTITVNYSQSLAEMIKAGKYDWTNSDITEKHFPVKGGGVVERMLTIHHYNRAMESKEVIAALEAIGKEPVPVEDLLAFGAKYPEEQQKYPIIALGSVARVRGSRDVPYLGRRDSERVLGLRWFGGRWSEDCRFLARNKVSLPLKT